MTTLVGIKANDGLEGVVIAADDQLGHYHEDELIRKRTKIKIVCGGYWAIAQAGLYDKDLDRFLRVLKGDKRYGSNEQKVKEIIDRAIKQGRFDEVRELNTEARKNGANLDDLHCFLFGVSYPNPRLWLIDEFGNLKTPDGNQEFDYLCLGSGEDEAEKYLKNQIDDEKIETDRIRTYTAVKLALGALKYAGKNPDTGLGTNFVVLYKDKVEEYGEEIKKAMLDAGSSKEISIVNRIRQGEDDAVKRTS